MLNYYIRTVYDAYRSSLGLLNSSQHTAVLSSVGRMDHLVTAKFQVLWPCRIFLCILL